MSEAITVWRCEKCDSWGRADVMDDGAKCGWCGHTTLTLYLPAQPVLELVEAAKVSGVELATMLRATESYKRSQSGSRISAAVASWEQLVPALEAMLKEE